MMDLILLTVTVPVIVAAIYTVLDALVGDASLSHKIFFAYICISIIALWARVLLGQ